jgi:hypothetical protein
MVIVRTASDLGCSITATLRDNQMSVAPMTGEFNCTPWCNHSAKLKPDWLPDHTALPALYSRMVCTACGLIGADVRPGLDAPHRQRRHGQRA